jgi:hypothetical protein
MWPIPSAKLVVILSVCAVLRSGTANAILMVHTDSPSSRESCWFQIKHRRPVEGVQTSDMYHVLFNRQQLHNGDANRVRASRTAQRKNTAFRLPCITLGMLAQFITLRAMEVEKNHDLLARLQPHQTLG